MNCNFTRTFLCLLFGMFMLIAPSAQADTTDTFTLTSSSKIVSYCPSFESDASVSLDGDTLKHTTGYATLIFNKNNGTSSPMFSINYKAVVLYKRSSSSKTGNTMEIATTNGAILTQVVITFSESDYFPSSVKSSFSSGSATRSTSDLTVTWTPSETTSSVTFENNQTDNNWRITKVKVSYETGTTATLSWSADTATVALGSTNYSLPTLNNPDSLEITYSSSDTTVATIDSIGDISLLGAGTTTISATSTATDSLASATATYTLIVTSTTKEDAGDTDGDDDEEEEEEYGDYFYLVTSESELQDGDEITFVCEDYNVCIGTIRSSGNNFAAISVDITDHMLTLPDAGTSYTLLLNNNKYWVFKTSDGTYLCAPGSNNNNYLKTQESIDDYARATISIDSSDADATIIFQGRGETTTYNGYLLYNSNNNLFSCYDTNTTSAQKPVQIYKRGTQSIDVTISAAGYATLYYGSYNLDVPDSVTAYTITLNDDQSEAITTAITATTEGDAPTIPAGEAVVLYSNEAYTSGTKKTYSFPINFTYSGSASSDNVLRGVDEATTLSSSDTIFYVLGLDASTQSKIGFYWQSGSTEGSSVSLSAHQGYLPLAKTSNGKAQTISIVLPTDGEDADADAISAPSASQQTTSQQTGTYTLSGQRLNNTDHLPAGIYIIDGQKVIVR